jgi:hypothetical protein
VADAKEMSPTGYVQMVTELLAQGYQIHGFKNVQPEKSQLILRHDIDFDPDLALVLAHVEAKQGWRSHYFVLTGSEFYSLTAPRCRTAIRTLRELGHEVGLHFDASLYSPDQDALAQAVVEESNRVEEVSGAPVDVFSLHRPHPELLEQSLNVPGRINAYAPRLFHDIGYASDSRGAWYHGAPIDHPAVLAGGALQILTHPIWWTSDPDFSPHEKCAAFLAKHGRHLENEMMRNCSAYQGPAKINFDEPTGGR